MKIIWKAVVPVIMGVAIIVFSAAGMVRLGEEFSRSDRECLRDENKMGYPLLIAAAPGEPPWSCVYNADEGWYCQRLRKAACKKGE